MGKELLYRQCRLSYERDGAVTETVTWIPERKNGVIIEPGVRVTLKGSADESQFWTVQSVGSEGMTESRVKERERLARRYREATDI